VPHIRQAFFWLRGFSAPKQSPRLPWRHAPRTQVVGAPLAKQQLDDYGDEMNITVLTVIIIVIGLVLIILFVLRRNNIQQDDDDPLMARLAEATQRGENISLEDIELSQPFAERVVYPLLKKLGINTKMSGTEEQSKTGSLLKRIEQGQSGSDSSSDLSSLQARRVSASSTAPQAGSYFDIKARVYNKLLAKIDPSMDFSKTDEVNHTIQSLFEQILVDENIILSRPERAHLFEQVMAEIPDLQSFSISVSCPRLLSKRFESAFLIQIFLPKESVKVKSNIILEFQNQEVDQHVTTSEISRGDKIKVKLFHPDFLFSDTVTKNIERSLNKIVILGKPKDNCEPGSHKVLVSILDPETEQELESFTFTANVVDFAFGKISRPLLSRISAVVLGIGSFAMFFLTLLAQIDKTVGVTSGTAVGVLAAIVYANFHNLYQHIRPSSP
jgi:hypothetical protein